MKLKNKIVLVTGASTGIGQATAIAFAKEGATVILGSRSLEGLLETKKKVVEVGGRAETITVDLADEKRLYSFIKEVKEKHTSIDALINIAGIWHGKNEVYAGKDFETFDPKVVTDTFMVGVVAPSLLAHAFIPLMPKGSSIINLSGTFENGAKGWLPYYVSKRAIEDLTIGLAEELKDKGIRVNGISPSDTATKAYKHYFPQFIRDAIEPEEIGSLAVSLCSDETKNTTGKIFVLKKGKEPFEEF